MKSNIANEKEFSGKYMNLRQKISNLEEEQEKVENALEESEKEFRLLLKDENYIEVKINTEGQFLHVNSAYCEMFGKTEDELLGKTFMPLVNEEDLEPTANALKALSKPPHYSNHEQRAMTKNGWRWIAWSNKALMDEQGKVTGSHGFGVDVTPLKSIIG